MSGLGYFLCPCCQDKGWVKIPIEDGSFSPSLHEVPCPECNSPAHHDGVTGCLALALAGMLFVYLLWGAR